MEIDQEKLEELIDEVEDACENGAYHNCLSFRSLACCFLPTPTRTGLNNERFRDLLMEMIKQYSPQDVIIVRDSNNVQAIDPEQDASSSNQINETNNILQSPSNEMGQALVVLKEYEPVLYHTISGFLRQNNDGVHLLLELLVLLKVSLLPISNELTCGFKSRLDYILEITQSGGKFIDIEYTKLLIAHDDALKTQPYTPLQWVCINDKMTRTINIDTNKFFVEITSDCATVAAIGWSCCSNGGFAVQLDESSNVPIRIGWASKYRSNPSILLGDDSESIGFDGEYVYHKFERIFKFLEPNLSASSLSTSISHVDGRIEFLLNDTSRFSTEIHAQFLSAAIPAISFGRRSFKSIVHTPYAGVYPNVYTALGFLDPLTITTPASDPDAPVDLLTECIEFASEQGTICRLHPSIELSPKAWTLSFFVYPFPAQDNSEPRPWRTIFLKGQDQSMERTASVFLSCDRLLLAVCVTTKSDWNSTLVSSGPLPANTWSHIGIVCDNMTLRLYIQGKEDKNLSLSDVIVHNNHPFYFGKSPPGVKKPTTDYKGFRGYLQQVELFPSRACSGKSIAKLMKEKKQSVEATVLSNVRTCIETKQLVELKAPLLDERNQVVFFTPKLGGYVHVSKLFEASPKWPEEFHMEATIRTRPTDRLQVIAACACVDISAFLFLWGVTSDGQLTLRTKDRKFTSSGRYFHDVVKWIQVGVSFTQTSVVFYINRKPVEMMSASGTPIDSGISTPMNDLFIGSLPFVSPAATCCQGDIGNFIVFKNDPTKSDDEVAHYNFLEGDGMNIYDMSTTTPRLHGTAQTNYCWLKEEKLDSALSTKAPKYEPSSGSLPFQISMLLNFMALRYMNSNRLIHEEDLQVTITSGAVWSHVLVFISIHSILKELKKKELFSRQDQSILGLLRLLRANFEPLASAVSGPEKFIMGTLPSSVGLGQSESSFAQRLRDLLVEISTMDLDFIDEETMREIQLEAIRTHAAGLEIFYPTSQKRAAFLIRSLTCANTGEIVCDVFLAKKHLARQFLPFLEDTTSKTLPWSVADVQHNLLDSKTLSQEQVIEELSSYQDKTELIELTPEQLVVRYEEWFIYYRDNHCKISFELFQQLWKALVHSISDSRQSTSIYELLKLIQTEMIQSTMKPTTWQSTTTSQLQQWHLPKRYYRVVNCPIGVRAEPNVKSAKIGHTLNIGQIIESNHVIQHPNDSVQYISYGRGWVFDVDPNDGMILLEEQVHETQGKTEYQPYSISGLLSEIYNQEELSSIKNWQQFDVFDNGCSLSDFSTTVTYREGKGMEWKTALSSKNIRKGSGVYSWRVRINKCSNTGKFFIGLSSKPNATETWIGSKKDSFGWMLSGDFYSNNQRLKSTPVPLFGSCNIPVLEVVVDTNDSLFSVFDVDSGLQVGPSCPVDLTADVDYHPAVSFFQLNDSVSWLSSIVSPSIVTSNDVVPVLEASSVMYNCSKVLFHSYTAAIMNDLPHAAQLEPLATRMAANISLWKKPCEDIDCLLDVIEDILLHTKHATDNSLVFGCLGGQIFGQMLHGYGDTSHGEQTEEKWIKSKLFQSGFGRRSENSFLKHYIDGNHPTLDKTMLSFVGGSALALRMGGINLDRAIRGVIATMLYHCGLTTSAESVEIDNLKLPPKSLRMIWQKAVELKAWALRYKSSANTTFDAVAGIFNLKVDFLLSLHPCKREEYVAPVEPPSLTRRISMGTKRSSSFDSTCDESQYPEWEMELLQSICSFYKDQKCNMKRAQELLVAAQMKAKMRANALRRATRLLSAPLPNAVKAGILQHLTQAIRHESQLWNYQAGIAGCPVQVKEEVHTAFEGYYYCLAQLLSNASEDSSLQLTLFNACSLRILPEDHAMLASCRIFQILQEILDRSGEVSNVSNLRQATMKVVYLLAIQVASEGEHEDHLNTLSPPQFKRQLSGPQTLSANVFDMLFSELYFSVSNTMEIFNSRYRLDTIGNNPSVLGILSLLQFVSNSTVCQSYLCTPNWLSLLLTIVCFGQVEPQVRAIQLLSILLPLSDPLFISIEIHFDMSTLIPVTTSCRTAALLEFFLESIGQAMSPVEKDLQHLPRSNHSSLSLGSECISILRKLLGDSSWYDHVSQSLDKAYHSNSCTKQLGVLGVMGSFPEPIRFGGYVRLNDSTHGTVIEVNEKTWRLSIQKAEDQECITIPMDSVQSIAKLAPAIHLIPNAIIDSVLNQTALMTDSVVFLHHIRVAQLIFNEEPQKLVEFVSKNSDTTLKLFQVGATPTNANGLMSLDDLEKKYELLRSALASKFYRNLRDILYPLIDSGNRKDIPIATSNSHQKLHFEDGIACTLKQVSTFNVPVSITPDAIEWLEGLLNHILKKIVDLLGQKWSNAVDLTQVDIQQVQAVVEAVYCEINLPEMLQAACSEANEWLSNRDHWGKEWTNHENSIIQWMLENIASCKTTHSIETWSSKFASIQVGSYICATCECLIADVLSLSIEILRNEETSTPLVTLESILRAMEGDDELGRLLSFHLKHLREAQVDQPIDKTSDEKVHDVKVQSMRTMGFPEAWCKRALEESGHDVNSALNWILTNGHLLQEGVAEVDSTPAQSNDVETQEKLSTEESQQLPDETWSTSSDFLVNSTYSPYWKLDSNDNSIRFALKSRHGTKIGFFSSSKQPLFELNITDRNVQVHVNGEQIHTENGAFCDEFSWISYWIVFTTSEIYFGQGSLGDECIIRCDWKDGTVPIMISFSADYCAHVKEFSTQSYQLKTVVERSHVLQGLDVPNYVVNDLTFCFNDNKSLGSVDDSTVWFPHSSLHEFRDGTLNLSNDELILQSDDTARMLRILSARRLGLSILSHCQSTLNTIFNEDGELFVQFVSMISNREFVSEIKKPRQIDWNIPEKRTTSEVLCPVIQDICKSWNPLCTALCQYLERQMQEYIKNPTDFHWIDAPADESDQDIRQGADLRFLYFVSQWLDDTPNVIQEKLVEIWKCTLSSSHLHVKQIGLQILSRMLSRALIEKNSIEKFISNLSYSYMKFVTNRLIEVEAENKPLYTGYLQAHIEFLTVYRRALDVVEVAEPTTKSCLHFSGSSSYVDINAEDIAAPWTAQYTLCLQEGGSTAVLANSSHYSILLKCGDLIDGRHSIGIRTKANSKIYAFKYSLPLDKWSTVTLTASESKVSLYLDGKYCTSIDIENAKLPMTHIGDPSRGFRGFLSTTRYFDTVLDQDDILAISLLDLNPWTPHPESLNKPVCTIVPTLSAIAHWTFDEGVGKFVRDKLRCHYDVSFYGAAWRSFQRTPDPSNGICTKFDLDRIYYGAGSLTQSPCIEIGGIWSQSKTKALSIELYSTKDDAVEGKLEVDANLSCMVAGSIHENGCIEFVITSIRGENSNHAFEWMVGMKFNGSHRQGLIQGTWSTSIARRIPPRYDADMYFIQPHTESITLSDGGRMAMNTLKKGKKGSVISMGFGDEHIRSNWASNGIPMSDLCLFSQHDVYNYTDGFVTIRADTLIRSGKVYYEWTLRTNGLMQLGFVSVRFKPGFTSHGVGDHVGSFAVDGKRQKKWSNSGFAYGGDWTWNAGEVIGVMIDFDLGHIRFTHQGRDLGLAFTETEFPHVRWSDGFYPAGSFSTAQGAQLNLGQKPFEFQPPGYSSVIESCGKCQQIQVYSHRMKRFTPVCTYHRITTELVPSRPCQSISFGVYLWEFQITTLLLSDGIRIGICLNGVNQGSLLGEDRYGWALCSSGKIYHNNQSTRYSTPGFTQGDRLGIELNLYKGTLGFYRNKTYLGIAYSSLMDRLPMDALIQPNSNGGFIPALSLYRPHSAVISLGLKDGVDTVQYPLTEEWSEFKGNWKQGQRQGPGRLTLRKTEGFYTGEWIENELSGEPDWSEPYPLCVDTMYQKVWKYLKFKRSVDHPMKTTKPYLFKKGEISGPGVDPQRECDLVELEPTTSPCCPVNSPWYRTVLEILRFKEPMISVVESTSDTHEVVTIQGTWQVDRNQLFVVIPPPPTIETATLSSDLTTASLVSHASAGNHVLFRGNYPMTSGVHYWEVGVQSCNHGSLFIGIASSQITSSEGWGDYGFVSYRVRWCQADGEQLYGRYFSGGDTIGVRFDIDEGTLTFIKDGDDFTRGRPTVINMGVAFRRLRSQNMCHRLTFVPTIGCSHPGDSFTVKGQKWSRSIQENWSSKQLEKVLDASLIVYDSLSSIPLQLKAKHLFDMLKQKGEFQSKRFLSRAGIYVDISKTMYEEGIIATEGNTRITTRYGDAIVLGKINDFVWYVIEGDEAAGIWYWNQSDLKALLKSNSGGEIIEPWSCAMCTMLNEPNLSKCQICETPRVVENEDPETNEEDHGEHEQIPRKMVAEETLQVTELKEFQSLLEKWPSSLDQNLVQQMDSICDQTGQDAENVSWSDYWHQVKPLFELPEDVVAARLSVILAWNSHVETLLPFVDLSGKSNMEAPKSLLGKTLAQTRHYIFKRIKIKLWKDILELTTTHTIPPSDEYERPETLREVSINRILAMDEKVSIQNSVFGQLQSVIQSWDHYSLRRAYGDELQDAGQRRSFYVKFLGEGVDDHGGPYRAIYQTSVWDEPSGSLEFFIPCPNSASSLGAYQDKYILNPSTSSKDLEFLGKLIGMAVRHRIMISLNLSDLFWKPLVGILNERKDLCAIDTELMRQLQVLECHSEEKLSELDVEEVIDYLVCMSQSTKNKNLKKNFSLNYKLLCEMIDDGIGIKLEKSRQQLDSLVHGLAAVLPCALLNIFTPTQLEELVSGSPEIDLDMLRRITVYEGVDPSEPHVIHFWECLEEMTHEQRSCFVNFVLARSRLPKSIEEFTLHFKIQPAILGENANHDIYLPHSQTCFFSLSLPRYSSKEICMEKLLYAINNSPTMDADFIERGSAGWEHVATT